MTTTALTPAIQCFNLTTSYGDRRGIRDVNLRVERGEIYGFLGPNGAGKSTTLRTLLGFLRPASGRVEIFGQDVATQSVAIHRQVGNLPSEFSLEDRMAGRELLTFYAELKGTNRDCLTHAQHLAERLDADLDRPTRSLSRGNKQKIGIIQALFHQPELIVLDEPTTGLDPLMRDEFLSLLREARDAGATIFFSSHNLQEVEEVADRVGIIRDGELIAEEDPHALTGRAFRYVRLQFAEPLVAGELSRLSALPGVEKFANINGTLTFELHGPIHPVVQLASKHQVTGFDSETPPLDELFLTYYGANRTGTSPS